MLTYEEDIKHAVDCLKEGGVILYPTDTIWGLGCDATNNSAVNRLFEMKRRAPQKAMISLTDSFKSLESFVGTVPITVKELIETSERPITVIFDSAQGISDALKAEDGSVAFRIPSFEFVQEICKRLGKPLVSTSANISESPTPSCFEEIQQELIDNVDYVCRFERDKKNSSASKIVRLSGDGSIKIIRE